MIFNGETGRRRRKFWHLYTINDDFQWGNRPPEAKFSVFGILNPAKKSPKIPLIPLISERGGVHVLCITEISPSVSSFLTELSPMVKVPSTMINNKGYIFALSLLYNLCRWYLGERIYWILHLSAFVIITVNPNESHKLLQFVLWHHGCQKRSDLKHNDTFFSEELLFSAWDPKKTA